jgi:hypothetical protein
MSMGLSLGLRLGGSWIGGGGPLVIVGNSDTIVSGPITWTLSEAADYGYSEDGHAFVVAQPGLTILSRTNAATTAESQPVNGTMKNPQRNALHGYDGRLGSYSAGANQSFPISVAAGDVVVGAVHEPVAAATSRQGVVQSYSPLHFVSSAWPANTIAPAVTGWSGRGVPAHYTVDLDAAVAALPSYNITAISRPTLAAVLERFDRFELAWGQTDTTAEGGYEYLTTRGAAGSGVTNYGQNLGKWIGAAALYLMSNEATTEQKKTLLTRMISHGVQSYDPIAGSATGLAPNGGHWQFLFAPFVAALKYTGRSSALATLSTVAAGNVLGQAFIYDAGLIAALAPHDDLTKPHISRRRAVSGVSGNTITVATNRVGETGDAPRSFFTSLRLKRESDGASAIVASQASSAITSSGTGTVSFVIDAQPTPAFAPSDVVYFESVDPISVGDADWRVTNVNTINPSFAQEYRGINFWTEEILFARGIGAWHASFDAAEAYVVRANKTNNPAPARDYPTHHDTVAGFTFASDFWAAHAPALIGAAPVFITDASISGSAVEGATLTAVSGTLGGTPTITSTYQWRRDGVDISGATGSTYDINFALDAGTLISVRQTATNGLGSEVSTSAPVGPVVAAYAPIAVEFDGTTWAHLASGFDGGAGGKTGLVFFDIYCPGTWKTGGAILQMQTGGGTSQVLVQLSTTGRIELLARNPSNTFIASCIAANNSFVANTGYTVAFAWDTAIPRIQMYARPWGGAWSSVIAGTPTPTLDAVTGAIGRAMVGATNAGGAGALPAGVYLGNVWAATDRTLDLSIADNRALLVPLRFKGNSGDLIVGGASPLYLDGPTATWHTNKGTGGGFTLAGSLTTAPVTPT